MSDDFLAGLGQAQLNQISTAIYPSIASKLTISGDITQPVAASLTWNVTQPPTFDLGSGVSQNFNVNIVGTLSITPQQGSSSSEPLGATAVCSVQIGGNGVLGFNVNDLTFTSQDVYVKAFADAKKQAAINLVESLLETVQIPLGPVEGITFNGYAAEVRNGVLYAAASISGNASVDQDLNVGNGLAIAMSNALMQMVVANVWWPNAPKTFRPNDDITINLNSYSFSVANSQMNIVLSLSGSMSIDEWLGDADWDIDISPVVAQINISIDANRNVNLAGGSVSTPDVSINPDNFLATVTSIFTAGLVNLIISQVIQNQIPGSIAQHLSGSIFQIPILTESFQGINFRFIPTNLALQVNGDQVNITGSIAASAS